MFYVYHELDEVLSYTDTHMPKMKRVRLIGTYLNRCHQTGTHMLQTYATYKFQPISTIKLDMVSVQFPKDGNIVQIYGTVLGSGKVLVRFWTKFEDEEDIVGYIDCLREARQIHGPIECWNPQVQLDDSDVGDVKDSSELDYFEMALGALEISSSISWND